MSIEEINLKIHEECINATEMLKNQDAEFDPILFFKMDLLMSLKNNFCSSSTNLKFCSKMIVGSSEVIESLGWDFFDSYYQKGLVDGQPIFYTGFINTNLIHNYKVTLDHADIFLVSGKKVPVVNWIEVAAQCYQNDIPIIYYGKELVF